MIKTRDDGVEVKHCPACHIDKELSEFYTVRNKDGYDVWCKECRRRYRREAYENQSLLRKQANNQDPEE